MEKILISGAGIAGLALAGQLKRLGIAFTLIEKKPQFETSGTGIALPANAVRALRYMGFSSFVEKLHQVNRIIYSRDNGKIISQASLLEAPLNLDKFVALTRWQLLTTLQGNLREDIHYDVTITDVKQQPDSVEVTFSNPALNGHYRAVIGADGINSKVRELCFNSGPLVDLGVTNWRWVCEHPTAALQPTYMLGTKHLFLAYPIGPNQIYCYAHRADINQEYQNPEKACDHLRHVFANYKGIAKPLFEKLPHPSQIYTGRLRSLPEPLFTQEKIALIGDASSACSPMLQQGAASAFEDAIVLSELLAHFPVNKALALYQTQRLQRVSWVVYNSDSAIKSLFKIKSPIGVMLRNFYIKRKGPLNVLGWKHLLSVCPLEGLKNFIQLHAKESL